MKFPNAYIGVKRIFVSEILSLFSTICMSLVPILGMMTLLGALGGTIFRFSGALAFTLGTGIGSLIITIGGAVLAIIAFILHMTGLSKAGMDERSFKTAFVIAICGFFIGIIAGILNAFSMGGTVAPGIAQALAQLATMLVIIFIIDGVKNLARKLNRPNIVRFGTALNVILVIIFVIAIISQLVTTFVTNEFYITLVGYFAIFALLLVIVFYIIYLIYLGKAKNMLLKAQEQ